MQPLPRSGSGSETVTSSWPYVGLLLEGIAQCTSTAEIGDIMESNLGTQNESGRFMVDAVQCALEDPLPLLMDADGRSVAYGRAWL